MDVKLKVVTGTNEGQELAVAGPRFFIGRAEDCQLRPKSELISRHHCVLLVEDASVAVRDLGSRNGTFVNNERIQGECELKQGDSLKVGGLEFLIHVSEKAAGPNKKRAKVNSIKEAVARTVEGSSSADVDVSEWFDGDEVSATGPTRELNPAEVDLNATQDLGQTTIGLPSIAADAPTESGAAVADTTANAPSRAAPPKPAAKPVPADSGKAAADVLRQFFRRR